MLLHDRDEGGQGDSFSASGEGQSEGEGSEHDYYDDHEGDHGLETGGDVGHEDSRLFEESEVAEHSHERD